MFDYVVETALGFDLFIFSQRRLSGAIRAGAKEHHGDKGGAGVIDAQMWWWLGAGKSKF